ncbi:hypothetical protein RCL1_000157 [Eukaryota sp. TZLM3-RCL]
MNQLLLFLSILLLTTVSCQTLLISTGLLSSNHFKQAINEPFDFIATSSYTNIDFARYNKVFIALSGPSLKYEDVQLLKTFVLKGGHLVFFGSCTQGSFLHTIDSLIKLSPTSWSQIFSSQQLAHDPSCPLTNNLPKLSTLSSPDIHVLRSISDLDARVCLRSGDQGIATAVTKSLGLGHFVYIPLTPQDSYSEVESDWYFFKTLVQNSLQITKKDASPIPSKVLLLFPIRSGYSTTIGFERFIREEYDGPIDFLYADDFSNVPLFHYEHVILYMNSSTPVSVASFSHLRLAVEQGMKLKVFGGCAKSRDSSAALSQSGLLLVDYSAVAYKCTKKSGFSLFYNQATHSMVEGIPQTFELQSKDLNCYSSVLADPSAVVLVRNSDNIPVVAVKRLGQGHVTFMTFSFSGFQHVQDRLIISKLLCNSFDLSSDQVNPFPPKVLLLKLTIDYDKNLYNTVEEFLVYKSVKFNSISNDLNSFTNMVDVSLYETIILAAPHGVPTYFYDSGAEVVYKWLSEQGKRIIFYGGHSSPISKSSLSKIMTFRAAGTCKIRPSDEFDLIVTDDSDYLARRLPSRYSFINQECRTSCMEVADPFARVPIRREDGYGASFVASKAVGKGVFVFINLPIFCAAPLDDHFLSPLFSNALSIFPEHAIRTDTPSLALVLIDERSDASLSDYKLIQAALHFKSIKFDLLNPKPVNYVHLSLYSDVILLNNYTHKGVEDMEKLVGNGTNVFYMGAARSFVGQPAVFPNVQHVTNLELYMPSIPHFKTWTFDHPLIKDIRTNVSFSFSPVSSILAYSYDSVVIAVNGDNLPLLTCKTSAQWSNSTFTMFATSGRKLDNVVVPDLLFFGTLFSNWLRLTANDCQVRSRKHLVHLVEVFPKNSPQIFDTIQSALFGLPLHQTSPLFDVYYGCHLDYNPSQFSSLIYTFGDTSSFSSTFFSPLSTSMSKTKQKVFISRSEGTREFADSFSSSFFNISRVNPYFAPNPALRITSRNHPLVRYFPPVVVGSELKSRLRYKSSKIDDPSQVNVIANNSENSPVLVEKEVGKSKLFFFTSPLDSYASEDYYYRDLLLYNFYRNNF